MTDDPRELRGDPSDPHLERIDPETDDLVVAISRAIAGVTDTPERELPILSEAIDPEALETVLRTSSPGTTVSSAYHGCDVTVTSPGTILIRATDRERCQRSDPSR